jgi:ATP-binding cassette subfamily F protein 3
MARKREEFPEMITIKNLTIAFPEKTLFSNFNVTVLAKDRIGLMGKNGSGKSTLLKAIAGIFNDYHGEITVQGKVLYMDQYRTFEARTPYEYYMGVADTPEKQKQVRSILKGLGFPEEDWERDISTFSGGERTKLQLGRLFVEDPDFLLLDEPTNFLDIESIEFLKELLRSFRGGYIIISHDRDFLRNTCEKFWEINNERIWVFDMDFDSYHLERQRIIETQRRQLVNIQREIERLRTIIDRYKKWGREKFTKQAKSKEKMLEKMLEELESMPKMYLEEEEKAISIPEPDNTGYVVLEVKNVSWNGLLKNVSFTVYQGDKIAIVGPNGSGKTTLLKIITGQTNYTGQVTFGYNVKAVYLEQFVDQLDLENTVFDELFEEIPDKPDYVIRAYAGRFGFRGEDVFKTVADLSGGERQILALAKVLLRKPNMLILDEPTNHMDLETVEALESALKEYKGAVLLVSHDLELIRNVCNRFFTIKNGELLESNEPIFFSKEKKKVEKEKNVDFEEKKRLRNQLKSWKKQLEELKERENEITYMISDLENRMHKEQDYVKLMELMGEKEKLEEELLRVMETFEEIEKKIKEFENMED